MMTPGMTSVLDGFSLGVSLIVYLRERHGRILTEVEWLKDGSEVLFGHPERG